ncbi:hypothetical protein V8C86DRAFT_1094639 [Haematococcus lacustris]
MVLGSASRIHTQCRILLGPPLATAAESLHSLPTATSRHGGWATPWASCPDEVLIGWEHVGAGHACTPLPHSYIWGGC